MKRAGSRASKRRALKRVPPPSFGFYDVHSILDKLKRELTRLKRARTRQSVEDHAFNFSVTAWHLVDWVFADGLALGTVAAGSSKDAFQQYTRENCRELALLEIFANGQKHAQPEKRKPSKLFGGSTSYITITSKVKDYDPEVDGKELFSEMEMREWSDDPKHWMLQVAAHDSRDGQLCIYTLKELCEGALRFWRDNLPSPDEAIVMEIAAPAQAGPAA